MVSIPLLLAKLWSVFPKLVSRPLIHSLPHALERLSILVLSASAFFELSTALLNIAQSYRGISTSRKSTTRLRGSRSGPSRSTSPSRFGAVAGVAKAGRALPGTGVGSAVLAWVLAHDLAGFGSGGDRDRGCDPLAA